MHHVSGDSERRFGVTVNGRIHGELRSPPKSAPVENEIAGLLDRLDGHRRFSAMLWALLPGQPFDKVPLERWPVHFIQAAGTRDRMMVETRFDDGGADVQAVVRKSETVASGPSEVIEWDSNTTRVFDVEVFTAAEAVPLFLAYWQRGPDSRRLPPAHARSIADPPADWAERDILSAAGPGVAARQLGRGTAYAVRGSSGRSRRAGSRREAFCQQVEFNAKR